MKNCRLEFIEKIEYFLSTEYKDIDFQKIIDKLIIISNDYEIMERSTEVIPLDSFNEKTVKRYCACLLIDGKAESTIKQYHRTIWKLLDFLQKDVREIGVYDIRYFLACEKERGMSNRTLENTRANLSAFFQWLLLEEVITKNPCMNIKPIKYKEEVRLPFSNVELDNLRGACKTNRNRAMIELLLSSGIRVSELVNMKVEDIDFNSMVVHVKHGKGNKERITYMDDIAKFYLEKYLLEREEKGNTLFYNNRHTPLAANGIRYVLNEIATQAGISNVHPHRFRRTFASKLAKRGMKIEEIKNLLGHARVETTMTYIYTEDETIHNSYKKFIS